MTTPSIILANRTITTLGAHNITKPLRKNMIEDVINIGRLSTKSHTVPEKIVTTVSIILPCMSINFILL
ncbi:hypothetical protein JHK82_018905 [Glycine max]|uniref:Uncharacterized protein n=2 Tax=Glycine subgen. Soja TaxID=1462606 RepID=A0A0R0JAF0_SOYBN|nr:hypothetical protein JHK85_019346 [Glycine max]KAG5143210.1 hypothetical protein JHK82_018905 [Glycine max]KAH1087232.1 hypothetical protein GYH30_018677 [Glycine max]RZC03289.1 hypothetical protein D0Y65_018106 [Glycine soja]